MAFVKINVKAYIYRLAHNDLKIKFMLYKQNYVLLKNSKNYAQ